MTASKHLKQGESMDSPPSAEPLRRDPRALVARLGGRSLVLVGMMGVGKTSVGRRLAGRLGLPFADADSEIETAAGMSIPDIFARHGEAEFRQGERRVVARLLGSGQKVVATGGGAYMLAATREAIAEHAIAIWLKADVEVLMRRVRKRSNRPLLQHADLEPTLKRLIEERYPIYALADFTVASHDGPHDAVVDDILTILEEHLPALPPQPAAPPPAPPAPPTAQQPAACASVAVELGARRYAIEIGRDLIATAASHIAGLTPDSSCCIVTDRNVARLHLPALRASLADAGIPHCVVEIEPGEASKSYAGFALVCDAILAARLERRDLVVALGGGVVGDLAGFAAASVRRGMRLVQIPTTLLAQVDSSVGGKTAINSPYGKNLVGAFYQPSLVLADTGALASLPPREFRAGYAEVAKYGLIDDAPFFAWLERNRQAIFSQGPELVEAIRKSCAAKAAIVARDETEQGDRALLNLGHTFGHALESLTLFDGERLVHGEGVAIGLACAFRFSARLGHCEGADAARVEAHLHAAGLPTRLTDIAGWNVDAEAILEAMYQDKKVQRGALTFILARGIGQSFIARNIAAGDVRDFLEDELKGW
jgi:shikimate kinase/3-dehydroquinate synthase